MARKVQSGFERRPYQEHCLQALKNAFLANVGFGLFVLATGLGKTLVAMQFLEWLILRMIGAHKRPPRVLVMCHQKPILRQLKKNFEAFLGDSYSYALFKPKRKGRRPPDVDILFSTFQAMRPSRKLFGADYFDILIVDEGHHSAASSYSNTIKYFKVRFRYAMTATPDRMDLRDIRVLFGTEVYSKPLAEALAEKLLPKVVYKYYLETQGKLASEALKGDKPTRKLLDERFFCSRSTPERDQKIADTIVDEMRKLADPRVLVFCQSIAACETMTTYLVERGVKAAAVHSKIDDDEQEVRLDALKSGALQVLVARDVLNEGKDIPAINLVAIVRSTASRTIFEQQIGRGLRPGKGELIVLDFVANCDRIQYLAEFVQALQNAKKPRKGKRKKARRDVEDEDMIACVLQQDQSDLPVHIHSGDLKFEVVLKDLLEVLGRTVRPSWTIESGKAALIAYAARIGSNTLTQNEIDAGSRLGECPGASWVRLNLAPISGSLEEALRSVGLEMSIQQWTAESGKRALIDLAARLNSETLTQRQINEGSQRGECPSASWVVDNLAKGTRKLQDALAAVGLRPKRRSRLNWDPDKIKKRITALARSERKTLITTPDLSRWSREGKSPSRTIVLRQLAPKTGKLKELNEVLGLKGRWTPKSAGAALRELAIELGKKTLTAADIRAGSAKGKCPSLSWVAKHIAPKLVDVLRAAGLPLK